MSTDLLEETAFWEERCRSERPRIVGLCRSMTGNDEAAEDLVQETLTEAWRLRDRLRDEDGLSAWLAAIGRHVCRRWLRSRGQESVHVRPADIDISEIPDVWDLDVELERTDLVSLLDRALGLLPHETRDVLVAHYVHEMPHAEIAKSLGASSGAVAMRIARGKVALRRLLQTDFQDEAAAFGLIGDASAWQETRIWCPFCGRARLCGAFVPGSHLHLRCSHCCSVHAPGFNVCCVGPENASHEHLGTLLGGIKGYRPALNRVLAEVSPRYREGLRTGSLSCLRCGGTSPLRFEPPEGTPVAPTLRFEPQIHARCARCGAVNHESLKHLALQHPRVRAFWREHPRMQVLPYRQVERDGTEFWITTFQSVGTGAQLTLGAGASLVPFILDR